ncbi:MAG: RdgB/HAM1 family non-canonical purine NTP pyrophosphatase [Chloroflexi bacterium]|nr:RdgB/HAM1 family non-canonical purine NTP pyrophosphatase [Chloroflexota bacterium]MCI0650133.1 RdgB/HAM1 family non-canonical purine NTP pyrophosphatase [Chloroflexota bacterium]MCI0731217.1 RdgB/HAM1 family non-canonical purine NTP pyrophosphatase [Chloroflexota bacterium]
MATRNTGKVAELADLLRDLDVAWLSLDEAGVAFEVEETGETFEENAVLKATTYAGATGLLTLADDSGLEVDALGGRPGVYTARYGGAGLTSIQRYERLLQELAGVPWKRRTARFRCMIALAGPDGLIGTAAGVCEGRIAWEPAGSGGFGYDPVFYLPDQGLTMAQLPAEEKHKISHRGRAVAAVAPLLRRAVKDGER